VHGVVLTLFSRRVVLPPGTGGIAYRFLMATVFPAPDHDHDR
jgi:hypothetical protein